MKVWSKKGIEEIEHPFDGAEYENYLKFLHDNDWDEFGTLGEECGIGVRIAFCNDLKDECGIRCTCEIYIVNSFEDYGFRTFLDLLDFLKEYLPVIAQAKTLSEEEN